MGSFGIGVLAELFRLKGEVRGQTYYDFIERKKSNDVWNNLEYDEKVEILTKHGKSHLIQTVLIGENADLPK